MNNIDIPLSTILRTDILAFIEKCFYTLYPTKEYLPNYHIEAIAHVLEKMRLGDPENKAVFNLPPRHLKSELIAVFQVAWLLGHDPSLKIMIVSFSDILVRRHVRSIRSILNSDWYRETFPNTKIASKSTESLLEMVGGGSVYAQPVNGQVTGHGADYIIVDDCHKVGPGLTSDAVLKDINWFRETLMSRMEKASKARVIVVKQRSRPNDLSGFLLGQFGYKHYVFPAIAVQDEDIPLLGGRVHHRKKGDVLHPAYTSKEDLDIQREVLGDRYFEAQYQQNPSYSGSSVFLPEYFGRTKEFLSYHNYDVIFQSWDTAESVSLDAAYSVCLTFGMRNDKAHLLNIFRRQVEYRRLVKAAYDLIDQFAPKFIVVEYKSTGRSLCDELRRGFGSAVYQNEPRLSKLERAEAVLQFVSKKNIILVDGVEGLEAFEHEIYSFTGGEHETTDQVDALTQAVTAAYSTHIPRYVGIDYHGRRPSLAGFPVR